MLLPESSSGEEHPSGANSSRVPGVEVRGISAGGLGVHCLLEVGSGGKMSEQLLIRLFLEILFSFFAVVLLPLSPLRSLSELDFFEGILGVLSAPLLLSLLIFSVLLAFTIPPDLNGGSFFVSLCSCLFTPLVANALRGCLRVLDVDGLLDLVRLCTGAESLFTSCC